MIDDRAKFYSEVKGWLIERLDLDEVDLAIRSGARVVERWRQEWNDFKTQFEAGDELWSFNSPQER